MYRGLCLRTARRVLQPALAMPNARTVHVKSRPEEREDQKPLKFSASKGSHRRWSVAQSFGSDYQRPWWKVLPVSLFFTVVLLWAYFREETEIDDILYRPVSELLEEVDKSEEDAKNK